MSNTQNDIIREMIAEATQELKANVSNLKIQRDILMAREDNYRTKRELMEQGFLPNICTVCLDMACSGEYTHYE